jgi:hypothetical protein
MITSAPRHGRPQFAPCCCIDINVLWISRALMTPKKDKWRWKCNYKFKICEEKNAWFIEVESVWESMTYQSSLVPDHLRKASIANTELLNLLIEYGITLITHRDSDCVIYDGSLCVHSWTENWVGLLRSEVHPKIGIVIHFPVSQHNEWSPVLNWNREKNPGNSWTVVAQQLLTWRVLSSGMWCPVVQ